MRPVSAVLLIAPMSPCHCQGQPQPDQQCPDHTLISQDGLSSRLQVRSGTLGRKGLGFPKLSVILSQTRGQRVGRWRNPSGIPLFVLKWMSLCGRNRAGSSHAPAPSCRSPSVSCLSWAVIVNRGRARRAAGFSEEQLNPIETDNAPEPGHQIQKEKW